MFENVYECIAQMLFIADFLQHFVKAKRSLKAQKQYETAMKPFIIMHIHSPILFVWPPTDCFPHEQLRNTAQYIFHAFGYILTVSSSFECAF